MPVRRNRSRSQQGTKDVQEEIEKEQVSSKQTDKDASTVSASKKRNREENSMSDTEPSDDSESDFVSSKKPSKPSPKNVTLITSFFKKDASAPTDAGKSAPSSTVDSNRSNSKSRSKISDSAKDSKDAIVVDSVFTPSKENEAVPEPKDLDLGQDGFVASSIRANLKPHQVEGVKFMWDNIAKAEGKGCILAHAMGLGKSLQIVALVHTFWLRQVSKGRKGTTLLLAPSTLLQNWMQEFSKWLPRGQDRPLRVSMITTRTHKTNNERVQAMRAWTNRGGVLVMGYELFSGLVGDGKGARSAAYADLLCKMPELVILDEGHRLKNAKSKVSQSLSLCRTSRRVVLTGTPLQNNLDEYYVMISFVRPNLLGTRKRFAEIFSKPIRRGMLADSSPEDVRLAKKRTYVLTRRLAPVIQRRDDAVLRALLPPLEELVLYIRLSALQIDLYTALLRYHTLICPAAAAAAASKDKQGDGTASKPHPTVARAGGAGAQAASEEAEEGSGCSCQHLLCAHAYVQRLVNHPDVLAATLPRPRQAPPTSLVIPSPISALAGGANGKMRTEKEDADCVVVIGEDDEGSVTFHKEGNVTKSSSQSPGLESAEGAEEAGAVIVNEEEGQGELDEDEYGESGGKGWERGANTAEDIDLADGEEGDLVSGDEGAMMDENEDKTDTRKSSHVVVGADGEVDGGTEGANRLPPEEWAKPVLDATGFERGILEHGFKMVAIMALLTECRRQGERALVFSQSVAMLDVIEAFLRRRNTAVREDRLVWYRLDGATAQGMRQTLVNRFNNPQTRVDAFLISTNAGGVGLNLTGASRVILVDSSWNPATDSQAAVRAYRMGQQKPVFVYRLVACGTMEHFVYDRQVSKAQLAKQVVDETDVARIFSSRDLDEMFRLDPSAAAGITRGEGRVSVVTASAQAACVRDGVLSALLQRELQGIVTKVIRHEDATAHDDSEELTQQEQLEAMAEDELIEKHGLIPSQRYPAAPPPPAAIPNTYPTYSHMYPAAAYGALPPSAAVAQFAAAAAMYAAAAGPGRPGYGLYPGGPGYGGGQNIGIYPGGTGFGAGMYLGGPAMQMIGAGMAGGAYARAHSQMPGIAPLGGMYLPPMTASPTALRIPTASSLGAPKVAATSQVGSSAALNSAVAAVSGKAIQNGSGAAGGETLGGYAGGRRPTYSRPSLSTSAAIPQTSALPKR